MPIKYYDWIGHHAACRGEKVALIDIDAQQKVTYHELNERANALAFWLMENGIDKGDRVAVLTKNCPEFFEIQFACFKVGAICLPINWRLTASEISYIVGDSKPKMFIHDTQSKEVAKAIIESTNIKLHLEISPESTGITYRKITGTAVKQQAFNECYHDDISMIMYTSGTTGHPKGALITHQMTFYNCINLGIPSLIDENAVQFVTLPLFHTAGLNCYANPILHAGGSVLLSREFDPGKTLTILGDAKNKITHLMGVPAVFLFMMQHPNFDKTDLSRIVRAGVGGAPCPENVLKTWLDRGVPIVQGWGMTETSPGGTGLDPMFARKKIGSCGKPLLHTEIKIINESGSKVVPGDVGELLIKGPNVTPGYWNNPEATKNSFQDGWLKTGDAAREDEEGFLYIIDRWKDMYISGGENVYPAEVENIIYQLPEIGEAAVVGMDDTKWGQSGLAVIVCKEGSSIEPQSIIDFCGIHLARYKIPKVIKFVDQLPRNATGKVLKREIIRKFKN